MPVLTAELLSGMLTALSAYVALRYGPVGLSALAVALLVLQRLTGELLESQQRAKDLHRLATTDELTGLANRKLFGTVLQ